MDSNERPSFQFEHDTTPDDVLLCGFSNFGFAGLTAADFLVDQLGLEETGYVRVDELPAVTPFKDGTPRHHTRLFGGDDADVTLLVGELFIPVPAASAFSAQIESWMTEQSVGEVAVLSGVPIAHGPESHRAFYVATEDYRERRLTDTDIEPMGQGFLDGVNAELVQQAIDSPLAAGVFLTPVHGQAPDVEAALRLVEAVDSVYDLGVDTAPLQEFASEIQQYYEDLSERLEAAQKSELPEDRMYM